ncbi:MAG: hypothetical protein J6K25_03505 [Thermoguttaceae bacterium]|nr:hypothetical protein [Thermoguttaceae bacterium]
MKRKPQTFKSLQFLPLVAAVAALDSGLFNVATFAPTSVPASVSNVAFAADDETSARDEKTDAILALLDVPEGESGEFYRERLNELKNACADVVAFDAVRCNLVKYRDEKGLPQWRRAEPNSLENKVYVAARALYERLFDAPDIAPRVRDRYFAEYLRDSYLLYRNAFDEVARQDWRDFCAARLALEEAREPFPLGRVLALRAELSYAENQLARKESGAEKKTFADFPALAALTDDLAEKAGLDRLVAEAEAEAKAKIKTKTEAKAGTTQPSERAIASEERFLAALIFTVKLGAALPDLLAEERPAEETTEFYRQRLQELKQVAAEGYSPRRVLVAGFLAGKLADAEDLAPVERFEAFQGYVGALGADLPRALWKDAETPSGVERLTALLEQETKRKAEHPADAARVPYLRERLFHARYGVFAKTNGDLSEEDRAELERFAADALELLDDGPLPWTLGETWASTVLLFLRDFADNIDVKFATQLRKDVLARASAAESEHLVWTAKAVRDAELVGSQPEVAGRVLPNGETLDWAAYRGAPVLVEIFRANPNLPFPWRSSGLPFKIQNDAFFQGCVDAGLKVIRYGAKSYEDARRHYEATRPNKPDYYNAIFVDRDAPVVGPLEGQEGDADWAVQLGFASFPHSRSWILFDADGRVVTSWPQPSVKYWPNAPTLQEALQALYPNVPVK